MEKEIKSSNSLVNIFFNWYFSEFPILLYKKGVASFSENIDRFSLPIHFRTLFSPFKRYSYSMKNLAFSEKAIIYLMNFVARFIGLIMRSLVIIVGSFYLLFTFIYYGLYFICWFILPIIIILLFVFGVYYGAKG